MMGSEEEIGGGMMIKNSGSRNRRFSSSSRCQDCGNQAKRECEHTRCRSCCKSRGFECQTHVKSTWVPASHRRPIHFPLHPHHQITPPTAHQQHHPYNYHHYGPNPNKRHSHTLGLEMEEEGDFPKEASFPAVFRCVRVRSTDKMVDQYAYQTSVGIGGHIFSGILYDQGPQPGYYATGESSSAGTTANATGTTSSSYPSPFYAFNSQFFQHYPKS